MAKSKRERSWQAYVRGPKLFGESAQHVYIGLTASQPLLLEREPSNPVDANAIIVKDLMGTSMGYVAKEVAVSVAPVMDSGCMVLAKVISPVRLAPMPGYLTHVRALLWVDGLEDERDEVIKDIYRIPTFKELKKQVEEIYK